jgi:class 3 adenylate cyclase
MNRSRNVETIGRQQRNEEKLYTKSELIAQLSRFRRMLMDLVEGKPNLAFVRKVIEGQLLEAEDNPLMAVRGSYSGVVKAVQAFEHILDPLRANQEITLDGTFKTQSKHGVGVTITDIRGYTAMTRKLRKREDGLRVGRLLKNTYFPHLMHVYDKHQLHYTNYTGDGILAYSETRVDALGRPELPALDNTMFANVEAVGVTESIGESWKRASNLRLMQTDGNTNETGFGCSFGDIEILDPLVPDAEDPEGIFTEFNQIFREVLLKRAPDFEPRIDFKSIMRSCHATGEPLNEAARMQDADKELPEHTMISSEETIDQLFCKKSIASLFERKIATKKPRGLGRTISLAGVSRGRQIDMARLMQDSFNEAAAQPYNNSADKTNGAFRKKPQPSDNGRARSKKKPAGNVEDN